MYQILNLFIPIVSTPYISRVLGPSNIGIYSYTYSIVSTFLMVGSLGVAVYGQREIASCGEDIERRTIIFKEIQSLKTMSISLSTCLFAMYAIWDSKYTFFYLVQIPYFLGVVLDITWLYQGIENFRLVAIRNAIIKLVGLAATFIIVRDVNDIIEYLLVLCFSQVIGNLTMWIQLPSVIGKNRIKVIDSFKHFKPLVVYFVPTVAYQIYTVLDKAMLGLIIGSNEENGFYEQAHKIINISTAIITSYTVIMRSKMSRLFFKIEKTEIKSMVNRSMRFVSFLSTGLCFGIIGVSHVFVPIFFGKGYDEVEELLYSFAPICIFMGISSCLGTHILTPGGMQSKSNLGQVAAAIANCILNGILIPHYRAFGAAIASVISQLVIVVFYAYSSNVYYSWKEIIRNSCKFWLSGLIMLMTLLSLEYVMPDSVLSLVLLVAFGTIEYLLVLLLLREELIQDVIKIVINRVRGKHK